MLKQRATCSKFRDIQIVISRYCGGKDITKHNQSFFDNTIIDQHVLSTMAAPLAYFLTFAFTASGLAKLAPLHPMHAEMLQKAPLWLEALQLSPYLNADQLRMGIGLAELICALLLPFFPPAVFALIFVMSGAVVTHYRLDGNKLTPEVAPAVFLLFLLLLLAGLNARKKTPSPPSPPEPRKDE